MRVYNSNYRKAKIIKGVREPRNSNERTYLLKSKNIKGILSTRIPLTYNRNHYNDLYLTFNNYNTTHSFMGLITKLL